MVHRYLYIVDFYNFVAHETLNIRLSVEFDEQGINVCITCVTPHSRFNKHALRTDIAVENLTWDPHNDAKAFIRDIAMFESYITDELARLKQRNALNVDFLLDSQMFAYWPRCWPVKPYKS